MKPLSPFILLTAGLLLLAALAGCSAKTEPPALEIAGPALIMFYTDG